MKDAEGFPTWAAWQAVTAEERREVSRYAAEGREHPDKRVAEAARGWAEVLVAGDDWHEERWWRRVFAVPGFLFAGEVGFTEWLEHRAEQRWARRVLMARPPDA